MYNLAQAAGRGSPSLRTTQSRLITSLRRPPALRSYSCESERASSYLIVHKVVSAHRLRLSHHKAELCSKYPVSPVKRQVGLAVHLVQVNASGACGVDSVEPDECAETPLCPVNRVFARGLEKIPGLVISAGSKFCQDRLSNQAALFLCIQSPRAARETQ